MLRALTAVSTSAFSRGAYLAAPARRARALLAPTRVSELGSLLLPGTSALSSASQRRFLSATAAAAEGEKAPIGPAPEAKTEAPGAGNDEFARVTGGRSREDEERARNAQYRGMKWVGVTALALATGGYVYFDQQEKAKGTTAKVTSYQTAGEIKLGGPWSGLVDSDGKPASSDQYYGNYMLIYFGFTHCPDICPTEINKMMAALDRIQAESPEVYDKVKTVFITVDPARDTQERLREYAKQYNPRLRWITGPMDKIKAAAKKYRVYFSIPDDLKPGEDYLVDHSIFFYMMGRDGKFMEFFGKNLTASEVSEKMTRIIKEDLATRPRVLHAEAQQQPQQPDGKSKE